MSDFHALMFRENLKRRRETVGMTQTELARLMKKRGHGFHQQTIQRIEGGERPVRIEEAFDLAEILNSTVQSMSERVASGLADLVYAVDKLTQESGDFQGGLRELVENWTVSLEEVAGAFMEMRVVDGAVPSPRLVIAAAWVIKGLRVLDAASELDRMLSGIDVELASDWREPSALSAYIVGDDLRWLQDPTADTWLGLPAEERPHALADLDAAELVERASAIFIHTVRSALSESVDGESQAGTNGVDQAAP